MQQIRQNGWHRVNKARARRLWEQGKPVRIQSANFMPFNRWQESINLLRSDDWQQDWGDFDTIVRNFEFYNCSCKETGTYAAFYIPD